MVRSRPTSSHVRLVLERDRAGTSLSGWPAAAAALLKVGVRMRSRRMRSTSTSAIAIWPRRRETLGRGEQARRARGSSPGRPTRGRSCSRRGRRPSTRRPPGSASTATRTAARGRRPCRSRRSTPTGCRGSSAPASAPCVDGGVGGPEVLADLDVEHEVGQARWRRTRGRCRTARVGRRARSSTPDDARARREPAVLVVLAVVRQEGLRHDAEDPAARDHHARSCRGARCGAPARRRRTPGADRARRRRARRWRASTASSSASCSSRSSIAYADSPSSGNSMRSTSRASPSRKSASVSRGVGGRVADGDARRARRDAHHPLRVNGKECVRHGRRGRPAEIVERLARAGV